ncbi:MAG: sulfotransferase domain-containing protein, partial [Candidatus Hodarchaeota archaeon]
MVWRKWRRHLIDMSEKAIDYFISYPKSGRTWIRFMYLRYLELHFGLIEKNVFDTEEKLIYYWQPEWVHLGMAPSEKNFFYAIGNVNFQLLQNCSCVWMTRSIYDTLVSLYHHTCHRSNIQYEGDISGFIRDPLYGALKICTFYAAMYNFAKKTILLKISYEDMQKDRKQVLLKILKYVGLNPKQDYIDIAVKESEFKYMQELG